MTDISSESLKVEWWVPLLADQKVDMLVAMLAMMMVDLLAGMTAATSVV